MTNEPAASVKSYHPAEAALAIMGVLLAGLLSLALGVLIQNELHSWGAWFAGASLIVSSWLWSRRKARVEPTRSRVYVVLGGKLVGPLTSARDAISQLGQPQEQWDDGSLHHLEWPVTGGMFTLDCGSVPDASGRIKFGMARSGY
mgnify:CR=1 FL=1